MKPRPTTEVKLVYNPTRGYEKPRDGGLFLKGPIPIRWLGAVCALPGKTVQVALAIWWLASMKNFEPIKVTKRALALFHVSNDAYRDAVRRLTEAGLISCTTAPGQRSLIKIYIPSDNPSHPPAK